MMTTKEHFEFCPQTRSEVKRKGAELDFVLWQGEQWSVTEYGLEKRDGTYHVKAKDMWNLARPLEQGKKVTHQCVFVHWFQHLSQKKWCDEDDIDHALQAFLLLFDSFGNRTKIQPPILMGEAEVEDYAATCANQRYEQAKIKALHGVYDAP